MTEPESKTETEAKNWPDIFADMAEIPEVKASSASELPHYFETRKPFVVRGLVRSWPIVQAGLSSPKAARDYLLEKHIDKPFTVNMGSEELDGRIFYRDDMSMNVVTGRARLPLVFERIDQVEGQSPVPLIYLSSIGIRQYFDGLDEENPMDLPAKAMMKRIWIGTRTRVAAHTDFFDNLACAVVGRRRFTVFPPEQFRNLYIGPLDNTPAGRSISMVDFLKPDFDTYPKFREALKTAQTITLEPGDAVFIPTMWWHHVESLAPFNILMNYWWRETPAFLGGPQNALNHAMMSVRDLPEDQKRLWRDMFDYYVFEAGNEVTDHIPEGGEGILGEMTAETAGKLRSYILKMLHEEQG